jgi:hypothetical protein
MITARDTSGIIAILQSFFAFSNIQILGIIELAFPLTSLLGMVALLKSTSTDNSMTSK